MAGWLMDVGSVGIVRIFLIALNENGTNLINNFPKPKLKIFRFNNQYIQKFSLCFVYDVPIVDFAFFTLSGVNRSTQMRNVFILNAKVSDPVPPAMSW